MVDTDWEEVMVKSSNPGGVSRPPAGQEPREDQSTEGRSPQGFALALPLISGKSQKLPVQVSVSSFLSLGLV